MLGPRRIAYLDVSGSGTETIAHVRENGRIVVMLCSFDGPPRILRLHGRAEVALAGEECFKRLFSEAAFEDLDVLRRRGQRHVERLRELAHGQLAVGQSPEHRAPRVMSQRVKHRVHAGPILNHVVEVNGRWSKAQPLG